MSGTVAAAGSFLQGRSIAVGTQPAEARPAAVARSAESVTRAHPEGPRSSQGGSVKGAPKCVEIHAPFPRPRFGPSVSGLRHSAEDVSRGTDCRVMSDCSYVTSRGPVAQHREPLPGRRARGGALGLPAAGGHLGNAPCPSRTWGLGPRAGKGPRRARERPGALRTAGGSLWRRL